MMESQPTRFWLRLAALLTALVGTINLISAVTPSLPSRVRWLEKFFSVSSTGRGACLCRRDWFFAVGAGSKPLAAKTGCLVAHCRPADTFDRQSFNQRMGLRGKFTGGGVAGSTFVDASAIYSPVRSPFDCPRDSRFSGGAAVYAGIQHAWFLSTRSSLFGKLRSRFSHSANAGDVFFPTIMLSYSPQVDLAGFLPTRFISLVQLR